MWYASWVPTELPRSDLEAAAAAVAFAVQVRRYHRRRSKRGSEQREQDIESALKRLKVAMKPLRSQIGRFCLGPQTTIAEENRRIIRSASHAIQAERRKLWKMQTKKEDLTV